MFQIANVERHRTSVTKIRGLFDLKSTSKGMVINFKKSTLFTKII